MASVSPGGRFVGFVGRRRERSVLDGLIQAVRGGESRALVVAGDPGIGKTALLDYVAGHARGCSVVRAAGVQSEMELAFAGLHQVCAPMLYRLGRLPSPQAGALGVAFGLASGSAPDRFVLGLAAESIVLRASNGPCRPGCSSTDRRVRARHRAEGRLRIVKPMRVQRPGSMLRVGADLSVAGAA